MVRARVCLGFCRIWRSPQCVMSDGAGAIAALTARAISGSRSANKPPAHVHQASRGLRERYAILGLPIGFCCLSVCWRMAKCTSDGSVVHRSVATKSSFSIETVSAVRDLPIAFIKKTNALEHIRVYQCSTDARGSSASSALRCVDCGESCLESRSCQQPPSWSDTYTCRVYVHQEHGLMHVVRATRCDEAVLSFSALSPGRV